MALHTDDVRRLDARAEEVGAGTSWELRFVVAANTDFVGLTANDIFIVGPTKLEDLAVYDIEMELDAIQAGEAEIVPDEDGDPRLFRLRKD